MVFIAYDMWGSGGSRWGSAFSPHPSEMFKFCLNRQLLSYYVYAISKDSDKAVWMCRHVWAFAEEPKSHVLALPVARID